MKACIIFPHQLFQRHPGLTHADVVYLVEQELLFTQFPFHKHKLILHRASMKAYQEKLCRSGYHVQYIECGEPAAGMPGLAARLSADHVTEVFLADPADDWLLRQSQQQFESRSINLQFTDSPGFLLHRDECLQYPISHTGNLHASFYKFMRKKWQILTDTNGNPQGGQWSFDADNRKRYPRDKTAPRFQRFGNNPYVEEANIYVNWHFPDNPGTTDHFFYPISHEEAAAWLEEFLVSRFHEFGPYEDAICYQELLLHHSLLSPLLNIGLLEPLLTVNRVLDYAAKEQIPIESTEGFIRQVIGWREYIRLLYERKGRFQRTKNYWNFQKKMPASMWHGQTGLAPFDLTVKKVLDTGYCHHIERLMVLGNLMLLSEINPDEVYHWFMSLFIDAYDWVMVPNIYGMSQFADGGLMCTKPYISGSNYLMKMGDFPKGPWQQTWDALFWHFMEQHRDFFLQNPRLSMLIRTLDKMPPEKKNLLVNTAKKFKQT